jgi:hypothetical protein
VALEYWRRWQNRRSKQMKLEPIPELKPEPNTPPKPNP